MIPMLVAAAFAAASPLFGDFDQDGVPFTTEEGGRGLIIWTGDRFLIGPPLEVSER